MDKKRSRTVKKVLEAFEKSEATSVFDLCRIAGVSREAFYSNLKRDPHFRKAYLQKQQKNLAERIMSCG